jgi:hypothetical protein
MKRVAFISHSSADSEIAERACAYLERHGVPCWIAPRDVMPGQNYGAGIIDAIDECRVFVLILSSHSNKSRQVVREIERAASSDSVILPFRIEDVQPSRDIAFYVSAAHWLDAAKHPVDEQFDELLAAIRSWQKADSGGEPVATLPLPVSQDSPVPGRASGKKGQLWLLIGVIGGVLLLVVGWLLYGAITSRSGVSKGSAASETPAPTISPVAPISEPLSTAPEPTASETPEATALATETPMAPSTAPPVRLRPGESWHQSATGSPTNIEPAGPRPVVQEVAASSQLGNEFRPNYAFDGDPVTGWVPKGRAIHQSLFVHFKTRTLVRSVSVLSNKVHTLRIILSDGTNQLLNFTDDAKKQHFELATPADADSAKFEIVSVFPGRDRKAGIAEIGFNEP